MRQKGLNEGAFATPAVTPGQKNPPPCWDGGAKVTRAGGWRPAHPLVVAIERVVLPRKNCLLLLCAKDLPFLAISEQRTFD